MIEDELKLLAIDLKVKAFMIKLSEYLEGGIQDIQKQYHLCDSFEKVSKLAGQEFAHEETKTFLQSLIRPQKEEGDNEKTEE